MIRTGLIVSAAAIAVMVASWAWMFANLPEGLEQIPVHWGLDGQADRFESREAARWTYLLLPAAGVLLAALFAVLPQIDPFRDNVLKGRRAYLTGWIGAEAMLALVSVGVAIMTTGGAGSDGNEFVRWIIAGTGVLFVLLGDALPKTRRNFFVGVRTPWTLSSDLSWQKTHRLAGWLFVGVGFWTIAAAFLFDGIGLVVSVMTPLAAVILVSAIYSFLVWRSDPDRQGARPA